MDPSDNETPSDLRLLLKPRGAAPVEWQPPDAGELPAVSPDTPLDEAQYVALDVETTGNRPFLVLEIGAERFNLAGPLSLFDTLVHSRAPINPYARERHQIDRAMLDGAPQFGEARRGFLNFARAAVLVEHSHDAFDTWLIGRGLSRPLEHPIVDTTALGRLVLELPGGQTPSLRKLVDLLEVELEPAHAALGDAQATAEVFRRLVARGREAFGWTTVGDLVAAMPERRPVDRSHMEAGGARRPAPAAAGPAPGVPPLEGPDATRPRRRRRRGGRPRPPVE